LTFTPESSQSRRELDVSKAKTDAVRNIVGKQNKASTIDASNVLAAVDAALITKVSTKGQEDGTVTQDLSFTFKQVALGYKMQKDDGKTLAAAKLAHWNVSEQTEDTPNIKLSIK